jgi:hypothetical protein
MTIAHVRGGIAPSPHAGVGMNVMRAVLGYAGAPVSLWKNGQRIILPGLGSTLRYTIAPPGRLPMHNTLFSLVEVPDLLAIPAIMPDVKSLWMGAGPVPELLHRLLISLARWRARLHLPALHWLAPICYTVLNSMRYGPHRGGMFIEAEGECAGRTITRAWHMVAEGDDGPLIPSMACEAIIRRGLAGTPPAPGARSGLGAVSLSDYEAMFAGRKIYTGWREPTAAPLYPQTLGSAFAALPATLQNLHQPGPLAEWQGEALVTRGQSHIATLVAKLFGFPDEGTKIPVTLRFRTDSAGREQWQRNFAGRLMVSTQEAGLGRNKHLIVERFGPFAFGLALVLDEGKLRIIPRRWAFLGLPLPYALMPKGETYEHEAANRFNFHVEINLPLIGPVVSYEGWLTPRASPQMPA